MRITGGLMKGIRLPAGFAAHVRPTTDMVRESLFNKLSHGYEIQDAHVLDLFSGSGIMAMEFLSREAAVVHSVDRDAGNLRYQKSLKDKHRLDNWHIHRADVFRFLDADTAQWDLIFADPPYDLPGINLLPGMVLPRLKPSGLFILEHRPGIAFDKAPAEVRNYGSTTCSIFVN